MYIKMYMYTCMPIYIYIYSNTFVKSKALSRYDPEDCDVAA